MNKGLINLWYENQNLIDVLAEDLEFKSYSDLLFNFFNKIIKLKNCKNEISDLNSEYFKITGIYEDKELGKEYEIEVSGYLQYGTCEMCDLGRFLFNYGHTERKKAIKLILLNIIQKANVFIEYPDYPDMEEFSRQEFIEQELCDKVWNKWQDISYSRTYKKEDVFPLLYFLMTYFYELDENYDEKIMLLNKKLIAKQELSKEECEKLKLAHSSSVKDYPVRDFINEIIKS